VRDYDEATQSASYSGSCNKALQYELVSKAKKVP